MKIGSDPEFILRNTEGVYLETGDYIADSGHSKGIGLDGDCTLGEIRAAPHSDPLKHARHIQMLISSLNNLVKPDALTMHSGGYAMNEDGSKKVGIGGHIHFSIPETERLRELLDYYLSLTLMQIEEDPHLRRGTGYGGLSDIRSQPHGCEYRTPSSWLLSYPIIKGVLSLAYTIAWEYKNTKLRLSHDLKDFISSNETRDEFNGGNLSYFSGHIPSIMNKIRRFKKYTDFSSEINHLFSMINTNSKWQHMRDSFPRVLNGKIPPSILPNYYDLNTFEVASLVDKTKIQPYKAIFYGISPKRNVSITISNEKLSEIISMKYRSKYSVAHKQYLSNRRTEEYPNLPVCIGFSPKLRKDKVKSARILTEILSTRLANPLSDIPRAKPKKKG